MRWFLGGRLWPLFPEAELSAAADWEGAVTGAAGPTPGGLGGEARSGGGAWREDSPPPHPAKPSWKAVRFLSLSNTEVKKMPVLTQKDAKHSPNTFCSS